MYYRRLTRIAAQTGWLRFSRIDWQGRPIAFHFGFCYRGRYLYYQSSFAIDLAHRSPGQLLTRHLLLAAINEAAAIFDFGLGDEPDKRSFATHVNHVSTWALNPSSTAPSRQTIAFPPKR
jgi:CelD/BcsL family acetyltransferase involved in cellulose biosynthesis